MLKSETLPGLPFEGRTHAHPLRACVRARVRPSRGVPTVEARTLGLIGFVYALISSAPRGGGLVGGGGRV